VEWVNSLELAIASCARPPVIVAHSLGCIAVAHWAATTRQPVEAALLVAPCDVDRSVLASRLRDFAPLPREKLDFPSLIAASTDDPYLDIEPARNLAHDWGSRLHLLGARGHINAASGFGPWPEGEALLVDLLRSLHDGPGEGDSDRSSAGPTPPIPPEVSIRQTPSL
jgi:hypothetical protein